jgi:cathepsin L
LPARDQGDACPGGCWAYATAGAYEQNYAFKSGQVIDVSESQIVDCSNKGDCTEGSWAFDYLMSTGTAREADYPHTPTKKPCIAGATPLRALQAGAVSGSTAIPPVNMIKDAICTHGAVVSGVIETAAFRNHRGSGVFSENTNEPLHHAIVIVGWDDNLGAWRVRNSRTVWGDAGYGWVSYGSNRIGHSAAWVEADAPPRSAVACPPSSLSIEGGTTASTTC